MEKILGKWLPEVKPNPITTQFSIQKAKKERMKWRKDQHKSKGHMRGCILSVCSSDCEQPSCINCQNPTEMNRVRICSRKMPSKWKIPSGKMKMENWEKLRCCSYALHLVVGRLNANWSRNVFMMIISFWEHKLAEKDLKPKKPEKNKDAVMRLRGHGSHIWPKTWHDPKHTHKTHTHLFS